MVRNKIQFLGGKCSIRVKPFNSIVVAEKECPMTTIVFIFDQNNFPGFISRKELLHCVVVGKVRIFENVFEISFAKVASEVTIRNFFFYLLLKFLFVGIF